MTKYLAEFIGTFFLVLTIGYSDSERAGRDSSPRDWLRFDGDDLRGRTRLGRALQPGRHPWPAQTDGSAQLRS